MTLTYLLPALDVVRAAVPDDVPVYADTNHKVEGTGGTLVEVLDGGPIGAPGASRFQRRMVRLNVLSDRTRVVAATPAPGMPLSTTTRIKDDADRKAWQTWERVDAALHDVDHVLRTYATCERRNGPALTLIGDGDGAVLLSADYEVAF